MYNTTAGDPNSAVYYYCSDNLGSVVALVDDSGAVVERYCYDVWGEPTITTGTGTPLTKSEVNNPYMFTAREVDFLDVDATSGSYRLKLQHNRWRVLNYKLARWMQNDPQEYIEGLNLYQYVSSSPVLLVDPAGLWGLKEHSDISASSLGNVWMQCVSCVCKNDPAFTQGIKMGSIYTDIQGPVNFIRTHWGDKAWEHSMYSNEKHPKEIQDKIINKFLGYVNVSRKDPQCWNKGFYLGLIMHTIQDTYARSHTTRNADGTITRFQDYSKQDKKKHKYGDNITGDGETFDNIDLYNDANAAVRDLLKMILCDEADDQALRNKLKEIIAIDKYTKLGETDPKFEPAPVEPVEIDPIIILPALPIGVRI